MGVSLYLQRIMQLIAGGFLIFAECVGVDIQRGGELAVAEDTRCRCHIRTARDHQAGSGVAQAVDIELLSVDIPPLQGAALAPPHPCGDDELEVRLVLDTLVFQRGDDLLCRFLVGNLFLCFLCLLYTSPSPRD